MDRNTAQIFHQEKNKQTKKTKTNKFSTLFFNVTKKIDLSFNVKEVKSNQKVISILEKCMYSSLVVPIFANC